MAFLLMIEAIPFLLALALIKSAHFHPFPFTRFELFIATQRENERE